MTETVALRRQQQQILTCSTEALIYCMQFDVLNRQSVCEFINETVFINRAMQCDFEL